MPLENEQAQILLDGQIQTEKALRPKQPEVLVVEKKAVVTDEGSGQTPAWSEQILHLTFEGTGLTDLDCVKFLKDQSGP